MLNPFAEVNWHPDLRERRKFALSLIIGLPCVAIFLSIFMRLTHHMWRPFPLWLGIIGLTVGTILWLLPEIADPFYIVWYGFACCVGIVAGNLLFSAFYYFVLTPLGLCLRATRTKSFRKNFDRSSATYWENAEKVDDLKRYYQQF